MIFDSHYSQPYLYGAHPVSSVHTLCTPHTHKRPREVECVICACLHKLHGSEQLTWLLSNGENPSSGTVGAKQCTGSNNNPPPPSFAALRERELVSHPLIVLQPEAMIQTRITSTTMGGSN